MKKILCLLLVLSCLVALVACDSGKSDSAPESAPSQNNSDQGSGNQGGGDQGGGDQGGGDQGSGDQGSGDQGGGDQGSGDQGGNSQVNLVACLTTLLNGYQWNPMSVVPVAMLPSYAANQINPDTLVTDYSSAVSVSNISAGGMGEQWHMIVDNLIQSQRFFNTLIVVDGLTTTSIAVFNNYLDENPSETAHHQFQSGIYTVTISCDEEYIYYVLDYTATIPVLGEQTVQIALSMDLETEVKHVRVQLGDANALAYTISDNSYTFALKYLGVRRAFFELAKNNTNSYTGHIYEYLTVSSVEYSSAADFYINGSYVTAVGNKASGIPGFSNYICELYSATTGKLLGYEIREHKSIAGIPLTFNTLWFELKNVSGITSIKYVPATNDTDAAFYVNGSTTAWEYKNVGLAGGTKAGSRRFDIEFRKQYYYYVDSETNEVKTVCVEVPMLFVQEEYYSSLSDDVKSQNNITVSITTDTADLAMLMEEYEQTIDPFIQNKDNYTVDVILTYIGSAKTFN